MSIRIPHLPLVAAVFTGLITLVGLFIVAQTAVRAETGTPAPPTTVSEQIQIENIIREYLLKNPELMIEVLEKAEEKQKLVAQQTAQSTIEDNQTLLYQDPTSFVTGNPDGDVTIVEFFDYQCGYCKKVTSTLIEAVEEDGNVRLILKEFPILGEGSVLASKAALAARKQGQYMQFHLALLNTRGGLTHSRIMNLADRTGLDTQQLHLDMEDPALSDIISRSHALARAIGIEGTPAFIIGNRLQKGAISAETFRKLIAEARNRF